MGSAAYRRGWRLPLAEFAKGQVSFIAVASSITKDNANET